MVESEESIIKLILNAPIPFQSEEQKQKCEEIIKYLTPVEKEQAACTSYAYFVASSNDEKYFPTQDAKQTSKNKMALRMARRHLVAERWKKEKALEKMKETLEFRELYKINETRTRCSRNSEISNHPLMPSVAVCGYDMHNRAILIRVPIKFQTPSDNAFYQFVLYQLERALACTEWKSRGKEEKINLAVDYSQYESGNIPPFSLLRSSVILFQKHYPERLHMTIGAVSMIIYFINDLDLNLHFL